VKMQLLTLVLFVMLVAMVPFASALDERIPVISDVSPAIENGEMYRLLGSGFIPNLGQYDPEVAYVHSGFHRQVTLFDFDGNGWAGFNDIVLLFGMIE